MNEAVTLSVVQHDLRSTPSNVCQRNADLLDTLRPALDELRELREMVARCLSPGNENVRRNDWRAAMRDVQQIVAGAGAGQDSLHETGTSV